MELKLRTLFKKLLCRVKWDREKINEVIKSLSVCDLVEFNWHANELKLATCNDELRLFESTVTLNYLPDPRENLSSFSVLV